MYLHERGYHVLGVEDLINVNNDDMKWYRWSQLIDNRIPAQIVKLSRKENLLSLLSHHSPQAIIYVPTRVDGMERNDDTVHSVLKNFVSLLMNMKSNPQVVLVSYWKTLLEKGWLTSYETILSSMYSQSSSAIVRVSNIHESLEDTGGRAQWYVNDVCSVIKKALTSKQYIWDMSQCTSFTDDKQYLIPSDHLLRTDKWVEEYNKYIKRKTRNVTLGAYLSKVGMASLYGIFPVANNARYFFSWFKSARKHSIDVVLFHDKLSSSFSDRLKEVYPNTETVHIKPVSSIIANDQRYFFFYDYLLKHPEIDMLLVTDIRDVTFRNNPIHIMTAIGKDSFFAGLDIPFNTDIRTHPQGELVERCFPHYPHYEVKRSYGVLNNGVLGGKRSTLLAVMARLLFDIETSNRFGNTCCDMPSLQYILHNVFFEKTFVGYPYNSAFYTQTVGPRGLAIEHKLEFG